MLGPPHRVWKVGTLPGRSCRPPRGEPGQGGGRILRGVEDRPAGVRRASAATPDKATPESVPRAAQAQPGLSPLQPPASANPPAAPRAPRAPGTPFCKAESVVDKIYIHIYIFNC